jgi:hypothetical protein
MRIIAHPDQDRRQELIVGARPYHIAAVMKAAISGEYARNALGLPQFQSDRASFFRVMLVTFAVFRGREFRAGNQYR